MPAQFSTQYTVPPEFSSLQIENETESYMDAKTTLTLTDEAVFYCKQAAH